MKLHPSYLQDGKFLIQFYIQHFNDNSVNLSDQQFWLEHHSTANVKTLGTQYHLMSSKITKARNLVPYQVWIYLSHVENLRYGPFNFTTLNGCKTSDCIANTNWQLLISNKDRYDCPPPPLRHPIVHIVISEQPITQNIHQSIAERIKAFLFNLHFADKTLQAYGMD
jgi:hypothetical protein